MRVKSTQHNANTSRKFDSATHSSMEYIVTTKPTRCVTDLNDSTICEIVEFSIQMDQNNYFMCNIHVSIAW